MPNILEKLKQDSKYIKFLKEFNEKAGIVLAAVVLHTPEEADPKLKARVEALQAQYSKLKNDLNECDPEKIIEFTEELRRVCAEPKIKSEVKGLKDFLKYIEAFFIKQGLKTTADIKNYKNVGLENDVNEVKNFVNKLHHKRSQNNPSHKGI